MSLNTLVTEDDEPVDMLSEKQQRLLTEPLYSSWAGPGGGRSFLAAANMGVFPVPRNPAIVPDMFLSLDVQVNPTNWWDKRHRSYFVWEFGKVPDLVVEIVSNQRGGEIGGKRLRYAEMGVGYYVIQDLFHRVMRDDLRVYRLSGRRYERQERPWFPELGLGMMLWEGEFEGVRGRWLRWTDAQGELILTGKQRAEQEAAARQAAETRFQQEAAARQAAEIRFQQEAAARQAAARQAAETRFQQEAAARRQEAAARQAAEARVAELEALLGRRST